MGEPSWWVLLLLALGAAVLGVRGIRGLLDVHEAIRFGELARLDAPRDWPIARAFVALCATIPVYLATAGLGAGAIGAALVAALLAHAVTPRLLEASRARLRRVLQDELALHLDIIATVVEAGGSLTAALHACVERAPDGPLRRTWARTLLEVHAGRELLDALRELDARISLRSLSALVAALRGADKAGIDPAGILRERARQAASARFARAERLARAAPLKLWATMLLCIAPCSLLVLALPVARLLALIAE